jgi:drug/metabolite transporter (DMT)-like permease
MHMTAATVTLWLVTALRGRIREALGRFAADRSAWGSTLAGTFLGPFLGVALSIVAIQHFAVEIASTLMALPSVCPLPLCALMFGERIRWQAVLGTGVAMAGMTLLCLDG